MMGKKLDWKDPKDLIEKIIWLQFNSDTSLWTRCADKYAVRSYVEERGLKSILPKLYGKWDNPDDIDFDKLPKKFVLKTNNSCGQIIIVKDKSSLDIQETKQRLGNWLKKKYGFLNGQLHYLHIKPCIIAEELLEDDAAKKGKSLIDYKIFCFDGKPEIIFTCQNRTQHKVELAAFDKEWVYRSEVMHFTDYFPEDKNRIKKPDSLEEMLHIAAKLSKDIPQVRIDLYEINGKPMFGEMTFSTGYGYMTQEYYNYLGSKIDLRKVKKIR